MGKIERVLILMPDRHMGNLVVSLVAINALIESFGNRRFYLVVDSDYEEIVESLLGLDKIVYYPRRKLHSSSILTKITSYASFVSELRSLHPDLVIDLQGGNTSSIMTLFSGAAYRVGNSDARRAFIYNERVDLSNGKHKVYSFTEIAAAVGATVESKYYRLSSTRNRKASLGHILKVQGIMPVKPIICIHAGAGNVHKQWTTAGFAGIANWLSQEGFQVVFIGAARDLDKIGQVMSLVSRKSYNLGGVLSLGELMALFEMSALFLGNDSGPMHLAAALGTPVVALFGPVDERRWRPLSTDSIVLRGQELCENCKQIRKDCIDFPCITRLSPDTVKQAVDQLLKRNVED